MNNTFLPGMKDLFSQRSLYKRVPLQLNDDHCEHSNRRDEQLHSTDAEAADHHFPTYAELERIRARDQKESKELGGRVHVAESDASATRRLEHKIDGLHAKLTCAQYVSDPEQSRHFGQSDVIKAFQEKVDAFAAQVAKQAEVSRIAEEAIHAQRKEIFQLKQEAELKMADAENVLQTAWNQTEEIHQREQQCQNIENQLAANKDTIEDLQARLSNLEREKKDAVAEIYLLRTEVNERQAIIDTHTEQTTLNTRRYPESNTILNESHPNKTLLPTSVRFQIRRDIRSEIQAREAKKHAREKRRTSDKLEQVTRQLAQSAKSCSKKQQAMEAMQQEVIQLRAKLEVSEKTNAATRQGYFPRQHMRAIGTGNRPPESESAGRGNPNNEPVPTRRNEPGRDEAPYETHTFSSAETFITSSSAMMVDKHRKSLRRDTSIDGFGHGDLGQLSQRLVDIAQTVRLVRIDLPNQNDHIGDIVHHFGLTLSGNTLDRVLFFQHQAPTDLWYCITAIKEGFWRSCEGVPILPQWCKVHGGQVMGCKCHFVRVVIHEDERRLMMGGKMKDP